MASTCNGWNITPCGYIAIEVVFGKRSLNFVQEVACDGPSHYRPKVQQRFTRNAPGSLRLPHIPVIGSFTNQCAFRKVGELFVPDHVLLLASRARAIRVVQIGMYFLFSASSTTSAFPSAQGHYSFEHQDPWRNQERTAITKHASSTRRV